MWTCGYVDMWIYVYVFCRTFSMEPVTREHIRSAETFATFKKSLKHFILKNTYVNCMYP